MQAKTFDEWKAAGFVVNKGQKATGKNAEGKATFTDSQVKVHKPIQDGDYNNYDDDQYFHDTYGYDKEY